MNEVVWHQERHPSHHSHHNQHSSHPHSHHPAIHPSYNPSVSQSQSSQHHPNHSHHTVMLTNGQSQPVVIPANDMQNAVHNQKHNQNSIRSQDDAMVRYFFQRPQADPDFQNYNKQTRWALGDDSVLDVRSLLILLLMSTVVLIIPSIFPPMTNPIVYAFRRFDKTILQNSSPNSKPWISRLM